jgi:TolB protein
LTVVVAAVAAALIVSGSGSWSATRTGDLSSGVLLTEIGGRIAAANADGSGLHVVANPVVGGYLGDEDPAPSPDGALVAFVRELETIEVMSADGTGLHSVGESSRPPAWSPTGELLAYGTARTITVVHPDGSGRRVLVRDQAAWGFSWSPDGTSIAYPTEDGISVVDVRTGISRLLREQKGAWRPAWSPDGKRIAFLGDVREGDDDVERVLVMNADGSGLHAIGPSLNPGQTPSWSPDSTRLAYGDSVEEGPGAVVVVNATSGQVLVRIPPLAGVESDLPSWSPDGTRIAFLRAERSGDPASIEGDVWVARSDGSAPVQVTRHFPFGGSSSVPQWVPHANTVRPDSSVQAARLPATDVRQIGPNYAVAAVDGSTVALVRPDTARAKTIGIWREHRPISWLGGGRDAPDTIALRANRLYWSVSYASMSSSESSLWTSPWPRGKPLRLRHVEGDQNNPWFYVAGDRSLVVYTLGHSVWRFDGTHSTRIRHEATDVWPYSVNAGRILLRNGSGRFELIDAAGKLLASILVPEDVVWAHISAREVTVLSRSTIRLYSLKGHLLSARPVGAIDAADAASYPYGSLFAYRSGAHWHIHDVSTGHDTIFTVHTGLSPTSVAMTSTGLVYTASRSYAPVNGEVGRVPLAAIRSALRRAGAG